MPMRTLGRTSLTRADIVQRYRQLSTSSGRDDTGTLINLSRPLLPSRVNAPSTLPPPLKFPSPREPSEYRIKYLYKIGKSYLNFYKTGFKQVLANRKLAKLIRATHLTNPLLRNVPGTNINHKTGEIVVPPANANAEMSRAEYQFLRRHARDIKKVPVFAMLLAVFGEWLPLFVIFLDPLIPGPVLLPIQILKRRRKAAKHEPSSRDGPALVGPHGIKGDLEGAGIHDRPQLIRIARRFNLIGIVSRFLMPGTSVLSRIRRHEAYLHIDDTLLRQDLSLSSLGSHGQNNLQDRNTKHDNSEEHEKNQNDTLDEDELELAVEERGMWIESQSTQERRRLLNEWLSHPHREKP